MTEGEKRAKAKRLKIYQRGDKIEPRRVFIMYGWECQNCGGHTPEELMGKIHPDAPTIDHIIPLSQGGEHIYSNVQLLCRRCNCYVKGNKM